MSMYSRSGKINWIFKKSSVQSVNTMVSSGANSHIKFGPPLYDDFKTSPTPHLFVPASLINKTIMARYHV